MGSAITRKDYLANARLIIIKIGSAVLADPSALNLPVLDSLARQIAKIRQLLQDRRVVIVSSGAVATGRGIMAASGSPIAAADKTARQALAAIGQGQLVQAWTESFQKYGIVTAQALLTRADFQSRERFLHITDTFAAMLAWNVLPIVNENDTVAVDELQFGDNDCLASLLVNLVEADLFINLTSAPGVLAENPESNPAAKVMESIEDIAGLNIASLCGRKTGAGSGGMRSKLLAARRVAQIGVPTLILPGREADILLRAFGERADSALPGTWVAPAPRAISRRKFWLAYQSEPAGSVLVDAGAAEALLHQGRSLLPGGIVAVQGDFATGDLVRVLFQDQLLGVGFCNYSAEELRRIHGHKRYEIAAILGNAKYPDAIHRDNLLLDAAV